MKPCKVPKSIKVGSVFFSFSACSYDDNTSSVIPHEWHVRSIQNRNTWINVGGTQILNSARKTLFVGMASKVKGKTWVNGKWAKYIPKEYRNSFELRNFLPEGVYTTELQAIKFALKQWTSNIEWYKEEMLTITNKKELADYEADLRDLQKELKLLKSRCTKIQKKRNA